MRWQKALETAANLNLWKQYMQVLNYSPTGASSNQMDLKKSKILVRFRVGLLLNYRKILAVKRPDVEDR